MTDREQAFCLFHGDSGAMAVAVKSVAAVLETESLVPLVWRPPPVVGICAYHRDVVPVISLGGLKAPGTQTRRASQALRGSDGSDVRGESRR